MASGQWLLRTPVQPPVIQLAVSLDRQLEVVSLDPGFQGVDGRHGEVTYVLLQVRIDQARRGGSGIWQGVVCRWNWREQWTLKIRHRRRPENPR